MKSRLLIACTLLLLGALLLAPANVARADGYVSTWESPPGWHVQAYGGTSNPNDIFNPGAAAGCSGATVSDANVFFIDVDLGQQYTFTEIQVGVRWNYGVYVSNDGANWNTLQEKGGGILVDCGTNNFQTISGGPWTYRYIRVATYNYGGCCSLTFGGFQILTSTATPTPTATGTMSPTPTPKNTATPFGITPLAALCVTATPIPSSTPRGTPWATPTTIGTRTTVTPTATATGTVIAPGSDLYYDSGSQSFDAGMQPWGINGETWSLRPNNTRWLFHQQFGTLIAVSDDYAITSTDVVTTVLLDGVLAHVFPHAVSLPLRVSGSGMYYQLYPGERAYLDFWYYDPDYRSAGRGAWVHPANARVELTSQWSAWTLTMLTSPLAAGTGRATMVAIVESVLYNNADADDNFREDAGRSEAYVDNLRVIGGQRALNLPVCAGGGPNTIGGRDNTPKICTINWKYVDMYARCTRPADFWQIVEWTQYWWCRGLTYMEFRPENRTQLEQMLTVQNMNEPSGTIAEFVSLLSGLWDVVQSINQTWYVTDYRSYNWDSMLAFGTSMDVAPTLNTNGPSYGLENCPALISGVSVSMQRSACFTVDVIRKKFPLHLIQWFIDITSLVFLIVFVRGSWKDVAR